MSLELLWALPDPGFLLSADGLIVGANSAAGELIGANARLLTGQPVAGFLANPESTTLAFLSAASRTRQGAPGSLIWKRADGSTIETRCDGAVVHPAGKDRAAIVYVRCRPKHEAVTQFIALNEKIRALSEEVQQRRNVEQALHRSEQRYRTLITATSAVVWTADFTGAFSEPQPSWESFTGQTWAEYRGFGSFDAIHPDDRSRVSALWRESVSSGALLDCELRLWHGGTQSYHSCVSRATPIRDERGVIREWIGTITDIEDRKRVEDQMRQTQKLESLGVLAGGVAHDFNNLLVGILGNSTLALETLSSNNPARAMLRDVIAASETAAHLTKQLLAYAGKGRFVIEPLDMSDLIEQIKTLVQATIPKNVQLRLELERKLPCVEADLSQMHQLLMNLIINGAEAVPEGQTGTVLVTTGVQEIDDGYIQTALAPSQIEPGTYVAVEVHDTGSGMTEDVIAKIFDPFFSTKFTGRGLGLAAVLGIVRGHKGALKVYSTPGRGTTFKVLFPAMKDSAPADRPSRPAEHRHSAATVLVIDDEEVVRRTAKTMLERYGYSVIVAENGKEGVELFRVLADKVSLVLLDMTMPVMSGEETFRELRSIKPDVRVVLSSGYNEVEAVRRFTGKGLAGFLQKPYSAAALAERVRSVIAEFKRHADLGE